MPVKDGIAACREIAASLSETRVLTLTASNKRGAIMDAVNAGATVYLQKYSGKEMLLSTVREVAAGESRVQGGDSQAAGVGHGSRVGSGPVPPSD